LGLHGCATAKKEEENYFFHEESLMYNFED
jgi:hypothetical protein